MTCFTKSGTKLVGDVISHLDTRLDYLYFYVVYFKHTISCLKEMVSMVSELDQSSFSAFSWLAAVGIPQRCRMFLFVPGRRQVEIALRPLMTEPEGLEAIFEAIPVL